MSSFAHVERRIHMPKGQCPYAKYYQDPFCWGSLEISKSMLSRECNPTLDQFLNMIDSFGVWSGV